MTGATLPDLTRLLLLGGAVSCGLMALVWLVAERIRNAGIVDVAWSAMFAVLSVLYAWQAGNRGTRQLVLLVLVLVWSGRLAIHLAFRVAREHPREDQRYADLRHKWTGHVRAKFFLMFLFQGLLDLVLSWPFLLIALDRRPGLGVLEIAGMVVWVAAVVGEATADRQLQQFKKDPAHRGKTCREGLWRYSRHPNYFFEWCVWCGYFLIAVTAPLGWSALISPVLILYLLLFVSGVPMAEEQSLKSRGDEFREYQKTTHRFFPWFPRHKGTDA